MRLQPTDSTTLLLLLLLLQVFADELGASLRCGRQRTDRFYLTGVDLAGNTTNCDLVSAANEFRLRVRSAAGTRTVDRLLDSLMR